MNSQQPEQCFAGQVAVVTGAGSGIGRACAERLGARGAVVALLDSNENGADETAQRIATAQGTALTLAVDVTDEAAVSSAVDRASSQLGEPTILINAAGIIIRKSLLESTVQEWRRVLDVNLTGYFILLKNVIPRMRAAGGGSIVQIASIAGHIGYGFSSYTAAKGGILALTKQLAGELAEDRIRINSVSPGVVRTGLNRDTLGTPAIAQATAENIPVGRLGQPTDIAAAVCFLAGPDAGFVTGTDLVVDGGMVSKIHWPAGAKNLQNFHAEGGSTA